jgi:hypothetical protein
MAAIHPAADHVLPPFITVPGETDVLFVVMLVFIIAAVIGVGLLYFRLHALPEQIAHRGEKIQFQIVAVLGLLALFTHNHVFWIAGLLLALVQLPDFSTPLGSMAGSLEKIASRVGTTAPPGVTPVDAPPPALPRASLNEVIAGDPSAPQPKVW